MNAIPLVNNNSVDAINTSLIAIKKNLNNQGQLQDVDVNVNFNLATNCLYCAATNTTIRGAELIQGCTIKVFFTNAITGSNTSTPLVINYNNVNIPVKVPVNGSLADYVAKEVSGTYYYCQAYTTIEFLFDGSNFIITGNPVVYSDANSVIYTDGYSIDTWKNLTPTIGEGFVWKGRILKNKNLVIISGQMTCITAYSTILMRGLPVMNQQVGGDTVVEVVDIDTNQSLGYSVLSMDYDSTQLSVGINAPRVGRFQITLIYLTD